MSDIHALSGAYAVQALDDLERAAFERHLTGCPHCRSEVEGLREASILLAETTTLAAPPELRERVLAEVAAIRPLPPVIEAPTSITSHAAVRRQRRPRRSVALLAAAAAAVVAVGVGVTVVDQIGGDSSSQTSELAAIDQVVQAPDAESFTKSAIGGGTVTVVRSASADQAVLMTSGLAAAPDGKTLEMWLKHDNTYIPAGFLHSAGDHTMLLDGDPVSADAFGLTVEPASGSTDPSDDLVVLLPFTSA